MVQLVVRNLDEETKRRLRRRAERHGRSMEAETRDILRVTLAGESDDRPGEGMGTRIAALFARMSLSDVEYDAVREGTEAFRGRRRDRSSSESDSARCQRHLGADTDVTFQRIKS
ncbi:hypothetical protein LPC08_06795 [Roseomonas sp. OT10]|uniref:FitA-like ribbon-helix-helix domain-containing protein n=1 Tax=Roseomonas cutis TaxID=2897332 RepID=UPI001E4B646A|nr:hypothetical protein [Roseomonas sp. OT10]UFN50326.1 hypothetical protein LPC08_06795 [Roseomonas sp. OT10]